VFHKQVENGGWARLSLRIGFDATGRRRAAHLLKNAKICGTPLSIQRVRGLPPADLAGVRCIEMR